MILIIIFLGFENFVVFMGEIMGCFCVYNVREDIFFCVVKMKDDEDINSMVIMFDEIYIIIYKGLDNVVLVDIVDLNEIWIFEGNCLFVIDWVFL